MNIIRPPLELSTCAPRPPFPAAPPAAALALRLPVRAVVDDRVCSSIRSEVRDLPVALHGRGLSRRANHGHDKFQIPRPSILLR